MDGSVQRTPAIIPHEGKNGVASFLGTLIPNEVEQLFSDEIAFLDTEDMQRLMLERPPFFFIERAVAIGKGSKHTVLGVAEMSEERCKGHFPGRPIVPLIELCKAMAQTGIILASLNGKSDKLAPIAISSGPSKAIAKDLIDAPARILIQVDFEEIKRPGWQFLVKGKVFTNGEPIGTLINIEYLLMPRSRLIRKREIASV